MKARRGVLYLADLNPRRGTEPGKVRPVLVIQTDLLNDAGHPSTAGFQDLAPMAKGLLNEMGNKPVDAVVVELGDGIIGGYGVASLYKDVEIMKAVKAHVVCANDLVAAWGARELTVKMGKPIDVMSGPATDNDVGELYVENELKIPAANSRTRGAKLTELVASRLFA